MKKPFYFLAPDNEYLCVIMIYAADNMRVLRVSGDCILEDPVTNPEDILNYMRQHGLYCHLENEGYIH
jgi:hypothetical protein